MKRIKNTLVILLLISSMLFMYGAPALAAQKPQGKTAVPEKTAVSIDGESVFFTTYLIGSGRYFKLRDAAKALDGTRKQFDVNWDRESGDITILSASAYTAVGGELNLSDDLKSKAAFPTASKICLNNSYHELRCAAFNIDDNNYLKLSDLAEALDFYIASDGENAVEIDTSAGYTVTRNKIYYSDDIYLTDSPEAGVKSSLKADFGGDGEMETAELVASEYDSRKWTLVCMDGGSEASVPVFEGYEYGFGTSIAAGYLFSEDSVIFLVSSDLRSMPFGGSHYELYSLHGGTLSKIDLSEIMDGTYFDVTVDESNKAATLAANGCETTVGLSDFALSDYKLYGKEFCQAFFVGMKLQIQSIEGRAFPELVTTEAIAAVLPNALTDLHTRYRYVDSAFQAQSTEFFDINGEPGKTDENSEKADSVVFYSLSDSELKLPFSQIPYYQSGRISYMPEYVFKQFDEGHQPWLSGAVDVVSVMCSNLAGVESIVSDENVEIHTAKELKTKSGVDIRLLEETGKTSRVEMTVPGLGAYDVTLESPDGTAILFIREIVFRPALPESGSAAPSAIPIYTIQDRLGLSPAPAELPDYESGNLVSSQLISYEDWYNAGGHQPWRRDPFFLMRVVASNLIPKAVSPDYFNTDWVESGNTAKTEDGLKVKLLSPDDPSLDNPSDATELTYQLIVPSLGSYDITVTRPYGSALFIITKILFHPGSFDLRDGAGAEFTEQKLFDQKLPVLSLEEHQIICEGKIDGITQGFYRSDEKSETGIEFYSYLSIGGVKYDLGYVGYGSDGEREDMLKSCGFTETDIDSETPVYRQLRILGAAAAETSYFTIRDDIPYLLYDMPGIGGQYDLDGDGSVETVSNAGSSVFIQDVLYEWHTGAETVGLLPLSEALGCDIASYNPDDNLIYTYHFIYDDKGGVTEPPAKGSLYRYTGGKLVRSDDAD